MTYEVIENDDGTCLVSGAFTSVIAYAQSKQHLLNSVKPLNSALGAIKPYIDFCINEFGPDAIKGSTTHNWIYNSVNIWTWDIDDYFYFEHEEDAVAFKLRFS